MERKCPRCDAEDNFLDTNLVDGIICEECNTVVNEERAKGYAKGYELGEKVFEEAVEAVN